ncbi:amidase family protein [Sedimentitalea sp. JM2-8]|uniref:Amidase family protein n=1 Tax=Sedimentitalea xiamensis TaxID=3050037 RepID=A0ABT7FJH2_9RHOB|nr:amidase family protein [Sedimentitalea xiamensis]MDK3075293.1 amidase family protein [Sedimentitalea xiamensis]
MTTKVLRFITLPLAACVVALCPVATLAQDDGQMPRLRPLEFPALPEGTPALPDDIVATLDQVLPTLTIPELQGFMEDGQLTSMILTRYYLERIEALDERYRTYIEINPAALEEAAAADARRAEGGGLGPLDGIPVSLKDNIGTAAPMHTTAGAEILLDYTPEADAPLVQQLRAGGAVILGKANLSEFAGAISLGLILGGSTAVAGQGINPHGPFATGGSSSGSAGAVSANLTVVSVGSETSGSLIAPSAWQSVVGMKPSRDLISGEGVIPLLSNNDSPGPIARTVTDAALLLGVIDTAEVDYGAGLSTDALKGVTVGVLSSELAAQPGNADLLQRIAATLTLTGAEVVPASLAGWQSALSAFDLFLAGGIRYEMTAFVGTVVPEIDGPEALVAYYATAPETRAPFGSDLLAGKVSQAAELPEDDFRSLGPTLTANATQLLEAAFAASGAEALVSIDNDHAQVYATAGYPAITVPLGARSAGGLMAALGRESAGMPVGVTLIGKQGEDAALLGYAYAFEQASNYRLVPEIER